jgi:hypothetical protein
MPNFESFLTSILHRPQVSPHARKQKRNPLNAANEAAFVARCGFQRSIVTFLTQWMTSGSHGKPYANWALPGAAYAIGANGKSLIDEDVLRSVEIRLVDTLDWLVASRRTSDEHRSSEEMSVEDVDFQDRLVDAALRQSQSQNV